MRGRGGKRRVEGAARREDTTGEPLADGRLALRRVELLSAFARGILCEFDGECRYRDVWTTDERLLAMPSEQLIGRTIAEALGEEVGRPLMNATLRVFNTGTPETREYTLPLAMGPRAFEACIVRIRGVSDAEPYRAAALIRDVTEEKEMQRKLTEAERLAALGVLAAGIGHEINNPLMVVQQNTRLVSQALAGAAPDVQLVPPLQSLRSMLDDVLEGVQRMQTIVGDLRLFRREDPQELAPTDPLTPLSTAIELARKQIEQRAILERDFTPLPHVTASQAKLVQVFLNLLINATQAIPEGTAREQRIRVSTRVDARGWALVEIADTGCGVAEHEQTTIFDPFFTTKREGMGLGLSICQRIVTGCGGTIAVESAPGLGTTFRVSLPPHTGETTHDDASKERSHVPRIRRRRLLIIDDEPALLRVVAISLSEHHDVVVADGGDAALRILDQDRQFDAILCDLMMPLGDGMNFYERLAHVQSDLRAKVIFMTGGAFTGQARAFLDSIPNRTLEKPFGAESLSRVLSELT